MSAMFESVSLLSSFPFFGVSIDLHCILVCICLFQVEGLDSKIDHVISLLSGNSHHGRSHRHSRLRTSDSESMINKRRSVINRNSSRSCNQVNLESKKAPEVTVQPPTPKSLENLFYSNDTTRTSTPNLSNVPQTSTDASKQTLSSKNSVDALKQSKPSLKGSLDSVRSLELRQRADSRFKVTPIQMPGDPPLSSRPPSESKMQEFVPSVTQVVDSETEQQSPEMLLSNSKQMSFLTVGAGQTDDIEMQEVCSQIEDRPSVGLDDVDDAETDGEASDDDIPEVVVVDEPTVSPTHTTVSPTHTTLPSTHSTV